MIYIRTRTHPSLTRKHTRTPTYTSHAHSLSFSFSVIFLLFSHTLIYLAKVDMHVQTKHDTYNTCVLARDRTQPLQPFLACYAENHAPRYPHTKYANTRTHARARTHTHTHTHIHTHIVSSLLYSHAAHTHPHIHTYKYTCGYTLTCTQTKMDTHVMLHTDMHIHTQIHYKYACSFSDTPCFISLMLFSYIVYADVHMCTFKYAAYTMCIFTRTVFTDMIHIHCI